MPRETKPAFAFLFCFAVLAPDHPFARMSRPAERRETRRNLQPDQQMTGCLPMRS